MAGKDRSTKDKMMAAQLKKLGEERTTGVCPVCYQRISVDSAKSRYGHKCKIGGV